MVIIYINSFCSLNSKGGYHTFDILMADQRLPPSKLPLSKFISASFAKDDPTQT